jgi:hypothetical protein
VPLDAERFPADVHVGTEILRSVTLARNVGHGDVRSLRFENQAFVARGSSPVRNRRQRFYVDEDLVGRVFGMRGRIGHHDRERLADVAHLVQRNDELLEWHELGHRREAQRNRGHFAAAVSRDIASGEDCAHARHRSRLGSVDRTDDAVGSGASHDRGVEKAFTVQVVYVASFAGKETRVFHARNRLPDVSIARVHAGSVFFAPRAYAGRAAHTASMIGI